MKTKRPYFRFDILFRTIRLIGSNNKFYLFSRLIYSALTGLLSGLLLYANKMLFDSLSEDWSRINQSISLFVIIQLTVLLVNIYDKRSSKLGITRIHNWLEELTYRQSLKLKLSLYENPETYAIIEQAKNLGENHIIQLIDHIGMVTRVIWSSVSIAMLALSYQIWGMFIILLAPLFSSVTSFIIENKLYDIYKKQSNTRRKKNYLNNAIDNGLKIQEIKAYNSENFFYFKFSNIIADLFKQDKVIFHLKQIKYFLDEFIEISITIIIVFLALLKTKQGTLSIGGIVLYFSGMQTMKANLSTMFLSLSEIMRDQMYAELYFNFLDLPVESFGSLDCNHINRLELRNVSFKYKLNEHFSLNKINLTINSGEKVLLIGRNGSGKTTLMKLLAGLYDDYKGEILINGTPLQKLDIRNYRERISNLFQNFNKFEVSLGENIALKDSINEKKAIRILQLTGFADKFNRLDSGLNTQIGYWEKGTQFSGGEWQKVAIARSLFRDSADIYLIDEPTTSLDAEAIDECMEILMNLNEKTVILITHRVNFIKQFKGRIVLLEEGKVVGDGKHEELLRSSEIYEKLMDNTF